MAEPHPLKAFELTQCAVKAAAVLFQRPCSGSVGSFCKITFQQKPDAFDATGGRPNRGWIYVTASGEEIHATQDVMCAHCRAALRKIMAGAQASGLLTGRPAELAQQFAGLLWGDLMVSLLEVAERPNRREIARRARDATAAFLQLQPLRNDAPSG